jgi:hypothetical protein
MALIQDANFLYNSQANLTLYQRGPYYFGIKLFNHLPLNIKELAYHIKQFRAALCSFLYSKSFYTTEEYFNQDLFLGYLFPLLILLSFTYI